MLNRVGKGSLVKTKEQSPAQDNSICAQIVNIPGKEMSSADYSLKEQPSKLRHTVFHSIFGFLSRNLSYAE